MTDRTRLKKILNETRVDEERTDKRKPGWEWLVVCNFYFCFLS